MFLNPFRRLFCKSFSAFKPNDFSSFLQNFLHSGSCSKLELQNLLASPDCSHYSYQQILQRIGALSFHSQNLSDKSASGNEQPRQNSVMRFLQQIQRGKISKIILHDVTIKSIDSQSIQTSSVQTEEEDEGDEEGQEEFDSINILEAMGIKQIKVGRIEIIGPQDK